MVAHLSEIADKTFDYVVIGGGTSGLTVAARLAEDPTVSVAVLEAGEPNLDDPKILLGGQFGSTWGNSKYDWAHQTTPQKHSNGRSVPWNRGKGLGGSSGMNFYSWVKPPAQDIDAFEMLGNPGWNWEAFYKYSLRAEGFTKASEYQLNQYNHTHDEAHRGTDGPIKTTVPQTTYLVDKMFMDTAQNVGAKLLKDPYSGDINGVWLAASNLDRSAKWTRSYSATGYYLPSKDKPNFRVLTEASAARILFSDDTVESDHIATGVEFIHHAAKHTVHARKEVILSAGTIKSPHILELSGIGQPEVLKKIGVLIRVDLPGVGENLQDHLLSGISYELDPKVPFETFDPFRDPEFAKEQVRLQALDLKNRHRYGISAFCYIPLTTANPEIAPAFIRRVSEWVAERKGSGDLPPGLAEQLDIQLDILKDDRVPDVEFIGFPGYLTMATPPEPGLNYITLITVHQHPFSRGTIHAKSSNPLEDPEIDPHYFENPLDLDLLVEQLKFVRKLAETEPLKSGLVREIDPGPTASTDEQLKEYLRAWSSSCFHAVGSASMLPREKNGVVDPELRVYGTKNLRVADISVLPLMFAAHTQAAAYFVGEKAADLIKGL